MSVQLAAVKRLDKTAVVEFCNIAVVHEVRRFDVGRLRIALADEVDDGLQTFVADVGRPRNDAADEVVVAGRSEERRVGKECRL